MTRAAPPATSTSKPEPSPRDRDDVLQLVRDIAAQTIDDGLAFDASTATAEIIRDDDDYSGIRVTLTATLATARLSLHIDVNLGDPIWPGPRTVHLPRLLGGTITLAHDDPLGRDLSCLDVSGDQLTALATERRTAAAARTARSRAARPRRPPTTDLANRRCSAASEVPNASRVTTPSGVLPSSVVRLG